MTWEAGAELAELSFAVTRADLVRYAGAAGDFNPIHWSERVARSVGLPGVIAHGMYTMALAARALTEWVRDPAAVVSFGTRFARPVEVPDDDVGTTIHVGGKVLSVRDGLATLSLTVTCGDAKVLGATEAVVRC